MQFSHSPLLVTLAAMAGYVDRDSSASSPAGVLLQRRFDSCWIKDTLREVSCRIMVKR